MKKNDIILLLSTTAILVVAWIGFSIYHNSVKSTIGEALSLQIAPIAPSFDTKVIEALKKRRSITPLFVAEQSAISSAVASQGASENDASKSAAPQIATPSALLQPGPTQP